MQNKTKKINIFIFSFLLLLTLPGMVLANSFNANYIISDSEILDYNSMNLEQIKNFLREKDSYLSNYKTVDPDGKTWTAAEIIYDRAQTNKISPKFILVLLQKEMGLIETSTIKKQTQLDWATGYGCPDGGGCNDRWKGFWKQINSATLQFFDYIENPGDYTYQKGKTYTFTNPYSTTIKTTMEVTPANNATAGLYNYTPHVYNGNYNFYNIWQRYFTRSYPDGSLLQAQGEPGVWLIQNGNKRPFLSKGALTSRFDTNKIITVNKSDLDSYSKGAPIKFANYSIVRSPAGGLYLLVDDQKRGFVDYEAFKKIGYNPEEIENASWEDIYAYPEGKAITSTSTYPTGALLQDKTTGGVYWVIDGEKAPLHDKALLTTKFKNKKIIQVTPEELAKYKTITPVLLDDGELVTSEQTKAVYLLENGTKKPFMSGEVFESLGYKWGNIIAVSPQFLAKYPSGGAIK